MFNLSRFLFSCMYLIDVFLLLLMHIHNYIHVLFTHSNTRLVLHMVLTVVDIQAVT